MILDAILFLTCFEIPEPNRAIVAAGYGHLSVGRKADAFNRVSMSVDLKQLSTSLRSQSRMLRSVTGMGRPFTSPWLSTTGEQSLAVVRNGETTDRFIMAHEPTCLPNIFRGARLTEFCCGTATVAGQNCKQNHLLEVPRHSMPLRADHILPRYTCTAARCIVPPAKGRNNQRIVSRRPTRSTRNLGRYWSPARPVATLTAPPAPAPSTSKRTEAVVGRTVGRDRREARPATRFVGV